MAPITIRGNELDPANLGDVQLPADASKTNFVLVQLEHEMTPDMVTALREKHAAIVKRMQGNTWLVTYPPSDLRALESIEGVEHALVYVDDFVIHADLKEAPEHVVEGTTVAVALHEAAGASHEDVLHEIRGLHSAHVQLAANGMIYLKASPQDLEKIAELDSVQAIEVAPVWEEHNDSIKAVIGVDAVNQPLLASKTNLTGAGQVVAICDSGIDAQHDAFRSNKIVAKFSVRTYATTTEDLSGHGTHVAGTVAGLAIKDWQGNDITGVAPNAGLAIVAATSDPKNELNRGPQDWFEDIKTKVPGTCRIISNSYGENLGTTQKPYGKMDAETVDTWALNNPDYLIIFSAGNDGRMEYPAAQVGNISVAKNVLTIGATYSDRPTHEAGILERLRGGSGARVDYSVSNLKAFKSKRGTVAPFSSRGPVLDTNRTKPDLVAPGVCILSARANSSDSKVQAVQQSWINGAGTYPGGPKDTDKLIFTSGTSMAAPAVSGCAALLREALASWKGLANPSAPLMKALLINGADTLSGVGTNAQGFGQINMVRTLKPLGGAPGAAVPTGSGFDQGTARDMSAIAPYKTKVPAASAVGKKVNFIVTLVYHDVPGAETNNKMNLAVTYKGQTRNTLAPKNNENVLRILFESVDAGQDILIQVQTKLLIASDKSIPWGLAWDHFEV